MPVYRKVTEVSNGILEKARTAIHNILTTAIFSAVEFAALLGRALFLKQHPKEGFLC